PRASHVENLDPVLFKQGLDSPNSLIHAVQLVNDETWLAMLERSLFSEQRSFAERHATSKDQSCVRFEDIAFGALGVAWVGNFNELIAVRNNAVLGEIAHGAPAEDGIIPSRYQLIEI